MTIMKSNKMATLMNVFIFCLIAAFFTALAIQIITQAETYIILPIWLTITILFFTPYTIYKQLKQCETGEKIRQTEKSLEDFYIPLKNLFLDSEKNPKECYQAQKTKFNDIGCYSHLATSETFRLFKECQKNNDTLTDLLRQVRADIDTLQKDYKELKNQYFFSWF
jgi:hypothetical protein